MNIFYAKVSIDYTKINCQKVLIAIKTFGENEDEARQNIERMIATNWQDVANFEILKVSRMQIYLNEYEVKGTVIFRQYPAKYLYFRVKAESKDEAKQIFMQKTENWKDVIRRDVTEVMLF